MSTNRSNINNISRLLFLARQDSGTPFYKKNGFPSEILCKILGFTVTPTGKVEHPDFAQALRYAARGKLVKLKTMLDENPFLLALYGNVVTRGGLTIENTSILECALLGGDPEMAEMIMPYFNQLACGEAVKECQLARCQEAIAGLSTQQPYEGLENLINIIKTCSSADITAALNKNMNHESELNQALKAFRDAVRPGTLTQPAVHYQHYQTLLLALQLLESEWNNLIRANHEDRNNLVWRQVVGYLQRSLPAVDRFAFAQGLYDLVERKAALNRSTAYKANSFLSYPDCGVDDSNLSGLGFDEAIYMGRGARSRASGAGPGSSWGQRLESLCQTKTSNLQNLYSGSRNEIQHGI